MFFSPKDSNPSGRRASLNTGLPFSGTFDPLRNDKPFFPTLTKIFLIVGLGFLSWLATYTGMLELITANTGSVDVSVRIAMAFAVAMLMLMIIYLLDSLFSPISWWLRLVYICGYVFLTLISVGFGFGFYWKFLEARSESTRSAEAAVGQVQVALEGGQARLEQMQTTFDSLTALSAAKAEEERTKGGTCPKSPPGDGPRRRLRDADAKNFAFASDFVKQRAGNVKKDIGGINTEMAKLIRGDDSIVDPVSGTRNAFLRSLNQKLDLTITRFNALRTDPQLRQFRDNFATRSQQTVFDNGRGGTFTCPDSQLQLALKGVVKAIDGLPNLDKPAITAVEGSEAIVEAFRRLTTSLAGALVFQLPPTPQELRALQQKAVRSVDGSGNADPTAGMQAGLGEHDFIPFFIAIFVDLCLLLVSINRPVNRMQKLMMSAQAARDAQVHQILTRVHTVHEKGRSQRLDALHEVMFDSLGAQYVAVPLDVNEENIDGVFGTETYRQAYNQKALHARYLATLMAALEAGGLVTPAPTMTQGRVLRKLARSGSIFADSTSFRVYRFMKGAWPAIVLDDMLGASAQLDAEARATAALEAEERRMRGPSLNMDVNFGDSGYQSRPVGEGDLGGVGREEKRSRPDRKRKASSRTRETREAKVRAAAFNGASIDEELGGRQEPHFDDAALDTDLDVALDEQKNGFVLVEDADVYSDEGTVTAEILADVKDAQAEEEKSEAVFEEAVAEKHVEPVEAGTPEKVSEPVFDGTRETQDVRPQDLVVDAPAQQFGLPLVRQFGQQAAEKVSDKSQPVAQNQSVNRITPVEERKVFVSRAQPPAVNKNGKADADALTEHVDFDFKSIAGRFNPNA